MATISAEGTEGTEGSDMQAHVIAACAFTPRIHYNSYLVPRAMSGRGSTQTVDAVVQRDPA